jgi:hypothetical protein
MLSMLFLMLGPLALAYYLGPWTGLIVVAVVAAICVFFGLARNVRLDLARVEQKLGPLEDSEQRFLQEYPDLFMHPDTCRTFGLCAKKLTVGALVLCAYLYIQQAYVPSAIAGGLLVVLAVQGHRQWPIRSWRMQSDWRAAAFDSLNDKLRQPQQP